MAKKQSKKQKKKKQEKSTEQEQIISVNGLVVDYSLPSKAMLVDWLSKEIREVRIKEVVELFPKEIFQELEAIRRLFYYKVMALTVPAYTLKILPLDALPKFQEAIEQAKKRLKDLDKLIAKALKTAYSKKARNYYAKAGNGKARIIKSVSHRFTVSVIPLQINKLVWEEFLDASLKKQMAAIHRKYDQRKQELEQDLTQIKVELASNLEDLKRAKAEVDKAYEGLTVPVDLATMKIEQADLKVKIKDLKYQVSKKQRELNSLASKQEREVNSFQRSSGWVRQQAEETEKKITFDAKKLYQDQLETMIREALELLKEDKAIRNKALNTNLRTARESRDRLFTLMPTSRLADLFEKVMVGLQSALKGNLEEAKNQLEGIY